MQKKKAWFFLIIVIVLIVVFFAARKGYAPITPEGNQIPENSPAPAGERANAVEDIQP